MNRGVLDSDLTDAIRQDEAAGLPAVHGGYGPNAFDNLRSRAATSSTVSPSREGLDQCLFDVVRFRYAGGPCVVRRSDPFLGCAQMVGYPSEADELAQRIVALLNAAHGVPLSTLTRLRIGDIRTALQVLHDQMGCRDESVDAPANEH